MGRKRTPRPNVGFGATGGVELGELLGEVLAGGGDARVAVDHAPVVHRIYASRKGADFSRFLVDAKLVSFASAGNWWRADTRWMADGHLGNYRAVTFI